MREKDDRDTGYIPGSRNVPYRLMASCCPDLPTDRPIVTICDSGAARRDRGQHPARRVATTPAPSSTAG